jgi:hypothetical protein
MERLRGDRGKGGARARAEKKLKKQREWKPKARAFGLISVLLCAAQGAGHQKEARPGTRRLLLRAWIGLGHQHHQAPVPYSIRPSCRPFARPQPQSPSSCLPGPGRNQHNGALVFQKKNNPDGWRQAGRQ